jgi:integrase
MPKRILPLTDVQVHKAKPQTKDVKFFDGGGLFLLVTPTGGKLWRFKYRYDGKEKTLYLGAYPEISLADARQRRLDARKQLANSIDPAAAKKEQAEERARLETTFETVAREWYGKQLAAWSKGHADTVISRLERDVFPVIGTVAISKIKTGEVLAILRKVEARGALDTALRIKIIFGQVFRYAVVTGLIDTDVSAPIRPRDCLEKRQVKHHAAITDPKKLPPLLRAIDDYQGSFTVKCALRLAPLVFVRPGELQKAEWSEFDLDEAQWNIPGDRMKMKEPHLVPLSCQAVEVLKALQPLTGAGKFLFPGRTSSRPMSDNTINAALRYMGFDKETMTGHGFRAMARTILDEVLHFRPDFIEHQLAHAVRDPNGRAYNRTAHLIERKKMMQTWADYLDGLKAGAKVIPFRQVAA